MKRNHHPCCVRCLYTKLQKTENNLQEYTSIASITIVILWIMKKITMLPSHSLLQHHIKLTIIMIHTSTYCSNIYSTQKCLKKKVGYENKQKKVLPSFQHQYYHLYTIIPSSIHTTTSILCYNYIINFYHSVH